jgi:periplasmic divalent cation tolerance protein
MTRYSVFLITAPDEEVAAKITQKLLDAHLAACVTRLPVSSSYFWEGKAKDAKEILLLAKTRTDLAGEIIALIRKNHPYTTPEIIALPISEGFHTYLNWIGANTRFTPAKSPEGKSR